MSQCVHLQRGSDTHGLCALCVCGRNTTESGVEVGEEPSHHMQQRVNFAAKAVLHDGIGRPQALTILL